MTAVITPPTVPPVDIASMSAGSVVSVAQGTYVRVQGGYLNTSTFAFTTAGSNTTFDNSIVVTNHGKLSFA